MPGQHAAKAIILSASPIIGGVEPNDFAAFNVNKVQGVIDVASLRTIIDWNISIKVSFDR